MKPLFELAAEFRAIADVLMDTGADEQTLMDTLEGESLPLEQKVQQYGFVIRNLEAQAAAELVEAERMAERATKTKARKEFLEKRLHDALAYASANLEKMPEFVYPQFTIKLKKNQPSVEVLNQSEIPPQFMRLPEPKPVVAAPDKKAIADALKAGQVVPGVALKHGTKLVIA